MQKANYLILTIVFTVSLFISAIASASPRDAPNPFTKERRASVDIAILLDTSNSMDGLINQAKSQLWTIVQQFSRAQKWDCSPRLRVALFEYGNTSLPATEGYLRQVIPLTNDLDVLSEALFGLRTDGGDEYCGQVIDEAIRRLDWSDKRGSYKAIFIAGNEEFTQGSVDYRDACSRAVDEGVVVNTIHCGNHEEGVRGKWRHGAKRGNGEFFNIDQDRAVHHIQCPQDPSIIRLNEKLNDTYLWFGSADFRMRNSSNQVRQDSNAVSLSSSVAVSRSMAKSSKAYDNRGRDLVDSLAENEEILKTVPEDELPEKMQKMTKAERENYLKEMAAQRAELKRQIGKEAAAREIFLAEERKKLAEENGGDTLGDAVVSVIRKQLLAAGFEIVGADGNVELSE